MKIKQIELFVLSIAVLLSIAYVVLLATAASPSTMTIMKYALGVGVAIYVGYVFITQQRDRQMIDGLEEKRDELIHKIADKDEEIKKLKKSVSSLESKVSELEGDLEAARKAHEAEKGAWEEEKKALQSQIESAS
ncbi:MAG: hypothetical protein HWE14_06100 [Flavobacteriia bacterium]|nr:hypothetical protein [Flavobacteriia bacterium]